MKNTKEEREAIRARGQASIAAGEKPCSVCHIPLSQLKEFFEGYGYDEAMFCQPFTVVPSSRDDILLCPWCRVDIFAHMKEQALTGEGTRARMEQQDTVLEIIQRVLRLDEDGARDQIAKALKALKE